MKTSVTQCPTSTHPAKKNYSCMVTVLPFVTSVSCALFLQYFSVLTFTSICFVQEMCLFFPIWRFCQCSIHCLFFFTLFVAIILRMQVFSSLCLVVLFSCILRIAFSRLCLISKLISNSLFVAIDILADCHVHDLWTVGTLLFGVSVSRNFFS